MIGSVLGGSVLFKLAMREFEPSFYLPFLTSWYRMTGPDHRMFTWGPFPASESEGLENYPIVGGMEG